MEVGEIRPAEKSDFDKLIELTTQDAVENGWELTKQKANIEVYTKTNKVSNFKMIRLAASFKDVSAVTVYNTLHDSEYRKKWDKNMVQSYEICTIDANNDVGYYQVKTPGPLKNREFVMQRSWCHRESFYIIMNHSVYHKSHPPVKNVIRGVSYCTGYVIEALTEESCRLLYVTQSDPGGNLPTWLVNKLVTMVAPKVAQNIHKASKSYNSWKKKHNPSHMPWIWPDQMTADMIDWDDVTNTGQEEASSCSEDLNDLELSDITAEDFDNNEDTDDSRQ